MSPYSQNRVWQEWWMGHELAFCPASVRVDGQFADRNLTASARAIAEAEIGDTNRRNAAQIVANTRATEAAIALAGRLNSETILTMHHALLALQFETIHPFPDGNGRVGRALLHSMLRNKGLTRNVTLPISAGLLADTGSYFDALGAYREGDPTAMVSKLSEASFAAIANGRQLVTELRGIPADWDTRISARRDSAVWQVQTYSCAIPSSTPRC